MRRIMILAALLLTFASCEKITPDSLNSPAPDVLEEGVKSASSALLDGTLWSFKEYDYPGRDNGAAYGINSVEDYWSYITFDANMECYYIFYGRHDAQNAIFRVSDYGYGLFTSASHEGCYPSWVPIEEQRPADDGSKIKDLYVENGGLYVILEDESVKKYELRKADFDISEVSDKYVELTAAASVEEWEEVSL